MTRQEEADRYIVQLMNYVDKDREGVRVINIGPIKDYLERNKPKDPLFESYKSFQETHFCTDNELEANFKELKKLFGTAGMDEAQEDAVYEFHNGNSYNTTVPVISAVDLQRIKERLNK